MCYCTKKSINLLNGNDINDVYKNKLLEMKIMYEVDFIHYLSQEAAVSPPF